MIVALHLTLIPIVFALGAAMGSFANVCIYRIPWEKSVIWPGSHCPRCRRAIAKRDNVPILGWLRLGGKCRTCRLPISVRYPGIEALVGLLFVAVYLADVAAVPRLIYGDVLLQSLARAGYHAALVALLVIATFIDYDLTIIPDAVTLTGMAIGLLGGILAPEIRPEPAAAATAWGGLVVGLKGLIIGGGLVWVVRFLGSAIARREAMGFGDVTLLAMIGAFLGWQAAVLTFFLAPFFGLGHAAAKLLFWIRKVVTGRKTSGADRELPFGPYLSMAALGLTLTWPWLWPAWAGPLFHSLGIAFDFLTGGEG